MSKTIQSTPKLLNLGCGDDYRRGYLNVDIDPAVDPDRAIDLDDYPWDLPSDHFVKVEARHVLEHLREPRRAFEEIARILRPGGELELVYPIGHTRFEDATHRQFWNLNTAEQLAGQRNHDHEIDVPLRLMDTDVSWEIGQNEPLVELYTRYRLWLRGEGPWLGQVPGLYGEVTARYIHRHDC